MSKLALIAAIACGLATLAHATPKEAKVHIQAAEKAHAAGDYTTALVELEAAYSFDPQPDLLYAIGQVYSKLGKCNEAKTFFEKFKTASKDPQVSAVVKEAIAACKTQLATSPPRPPDTTTEPPKPPDTTTEPPKPPTTATERHEELPPPPPPAPSTHRAWYTDVLGDFLVFGGAAVAGVGVSYYLGARSDLDSAETAGTLGTYQSLVDDAHGKRTRAIIFIGAGTALVIGGVVRYMLHDRGGGEERNTVGVAPTHGGALITWGTSL